MKVNFLLGSGISIPAGLPCVDAITQRVLSGDGIRLWPDEHFHLAEHGETPMDAEEQGAARTQICGILRLLERLKVHAHRRFEQVDMRGANYEDLAYLAGQIVDDLSGNRENPALFPFIETLIDDLKAVLKDVGVWKGASDSERLGKLAQHAVDYIHDVVEGMLLKTPADTAYLQFFADAIRDDRVAEVNLFTLNHDTLLETYLRGMQPAIRLTDGFGEETDHIRRWSPQLFDAALGQQDRPAVRLYKLHGSIDWHMRVPINRQYRAVVDPREARPDEFLGTRTNATAGEPKEYRREGRSVILAGTFNKVTEYVTGVFLEMHYRFHRTLAESDTLIVIGYSFGDKGVNQRLAEWMMASRTCRLLVVNTRSLDDIKDRARGEIGRHITYWGDRFVHHQVSAAHIDWPTLKAGIHASSR